MNLAWPISGLVGPLAGGYLAESYGWGVVFIIAALISFLAIYPAMLVNKEKQGIERFSSEPRRRSSILDKRYLLTMSILFALQTCVATSMAGINMILPIYLQDRFNLSYALIGAFFTGSNVLLIFTQIGGGYLADRHGHRKILLLCAALAPFAIGSWILFDNWVALFAVYSIAFGLWSLSWPPILAMLTELLPAELRGTGFGLNMTGSRLGFTLGPIVAGLLYVVPGSSTPFIAAALIYALAFPLTYLLKDRKSDETVSKNQTFFL
jgi:MFS family permease